ncbi:MAG: sensor histidine kinase [Cyclobacteriaceae bacterium]
MLLSQDLVSKPEIHFVLDAFRKCELAKVENLLESIEYGQENKQLYEIINWKYQQLMFGRTEGFPIDSLLLFETDTSITSALYQLFYGDYLLAKGVEAIAHQYYLSARQMAEALNDKFLICEALKRAVNHVNDKGQVYPLLEKVSEDYVASAFDSFERDLSELHRIRARSLIDSLPYLNQFIEGVKIAESNGNHLVAAYYYKLIGVKYDVYSDLLTNWGVGTKQENLWKSIENYNRSLLLYKRYEPSSFAVNKKIGILINKGIAFNFMSKFDSATFNFDSADSLIHEDDYQNQILLNKWRAEHFVAINDYEIAYFHQKKELNLRRLSHRKGIEESVAELNTQYQTRKNQIERQKATNQRNILFIVLLVILLLMVILILFYRSRQRMMKVVALKNEEIFNQEVNQLLSEQELKSINSMIEGQEKERKRVAEDLHDRLGSTLTAAKMHVDVITGENGKLEKVGSLLDQALTDTREISHNMLSGVLTNFGLVPALRDLVETIEGTNSIRINLEFDELDKRLESQTEINVYRILQELISNTLKHAKASVINLEFKKEQARLLINFHDNGTGFDTTNVKFNGIGFKNISARISKIGGVWDYDTKPGDGFHAEISFPI